MKWFELKFKEGERISKKYNAPKVIMLAFFRKWFSQTYSQTRLISYQVPGLCQCPPSLRWFDETVVQLWAVTIDGLHQDLCAGVHVQSSIKPGLHSFTMPFFWAHAFVFSLSSLINSACHQMLPWNNAIEVIVSRTMKVYTGDISTDVSYLNVPSSSMWTGRKTRSLLDKNISSHCH